MLLMLFPLHMSPKYLPRHFLFEPDFYPWLFWLPAPSIHQTMENLSLCRAPASYLCTSLTKDQQVGDIDSMGRYCNRPQTTFQTLVLQQSCCISGHYSGCVCTISWYTFHYSRVLFWPTTMISSDSTKGWYHLPFIDGKSKIIDCIIFWFLDSGQVLYKWTL